MLRTKSVGRFARSVEMITQRPTYRIFLPALAITESLSIELRKQEFSAGLRKLRVPTPSSFTPTEMRAKRLLIYRAGIKMRIVYAPVSDLHWARKVAAASNILLLPLGLLRGVCAGPRPPRPASRLVTYAS